MQIFNIDVLNKYLYIIQPSALHHFVVWRVCEVIINIRRLGWQAVQDPVRTKLGSCSSSRGTCQNQFRALLTYPWAKYWTPKWSHCALQLACNSFRGYPDLTICNVAPAPSSKPPINVIHWDFPQQEDRFSPHNALWCHEKVGYHNDTTCLMINVTSVLACATGEQSLVLGWWMTNYQSVIKVMKKK